ncbi:B3 domain-containing transcription factor VRN1-like isoform X1 [Rosa rugosa]|uniref:B3 domain-containing transcription factor VRN1-like isoform X1 n=2 Tax=Rosa rugosa TaxID=74645 RepID=UPI002B4130B9|nr:B3 domain-containing transcription factor VRN1-like isoform X1 [Rosa rugosa]XP_062008097.1 B3 domain-containing transcription factor VRN1-like isoform X1 [Rosa rugosa]
MKRMGSLCRHQTFSSTTPHFFQIILEDTCRDIKIRIPKKFVIKYGEDVSNSACLKLPSGSEWEVELTRCNGKVWFDKGWPEFSKFCSLDYGDFLVFRYEGNSIFQVCIFDRTATEIDYPIRMPDMEKTDHEDEEDDDISIEILEDSPPRPKTREKSPLPCPPSFKKMRSSWSGKAADTMFGNDGEGLSSARGYLKGTVEATGEMHSLNKSEKAQALWRADAFISENPHFKIVLQPSYVQQSYLRFPVNFLKRNLIKDAGNVTLRVSNGKTWSVQFKHEKSRARLKHGWLAFVKDNCLKVGDVCIFVLIKDNKLLFQVEFFRATSFPLLPGHGRGAIEQVEHDRSSTIKVESECSMNCGMASINPSPLDIGKNRRSKTSGKVAQRRCSSLRVPRVNLEAANKFIPNNPFFKVSLGACHMEKSNVSVPTSFIRRFIKRLEKQTVMLQIKNRVWPVNLIPYAYSNQRLSAKLCGGWVAFAREHDLKGGDVYVFELMEMEANIVLKVHIFRSD